MTMPKTVTACVLCDGDATRPKGGEYLKVAVAPEVQRVLGLTRPFAQPVCLDCAEDLEKKQDATFRVPCPRRPHDSPIPAEECTQAQLNYYNGELGSARWCRGSACRKFLAHSEKPAEEILAEIRAAEAAARAEKGDLWDGAP